MLQACSRIALADTPSTRPQHVVQSAASAAAIPIIDCDIDSDTDTDAGVGGPNPAGLRPSCNGHLATEVPCSLRTAPQPRATRMPDTPTEGLGDLFVPGVGTPHEPNVVKEGPLVVRRGLCHCHSILGYCGAGQSTLGGTVTPSLGASFGMGKGYRSYEGQWMRHRWHLPWPQAQALVLSHRQEELALWPWN